MDANTLLNCDRSSGRVELAATVALTTCSPDTQCSRYLTALRQAIADEPPPFDTQQYADIYDNSSTSWQWMAVSLITNAEREGDGAKRLWSLSACSRDQKVQHLLKQHAVDESRHALLYLALLDLAFPGCVELSFREELNQLSPHYMLTQQVFPVPGSPYAKNATIDDFLQMNIAEIRTAIHHILQRPALAKHSGSDKMKRIVSIQDSLLRDELKHVSYTAVLIEQAAEKFTADQLADLFRRRFHDFNRITFDELGEGTFDCSVRCCATHPSCRSKVVPADFEKAVDVTHILPLVM